ncbi:hypothetical protein Tco_1461677 [Tanacetum coccineum]
MGTLIKIESAKPKVKKVVIQKPEQSTTTTTPIAKPKAKGIVIQESEETTTRTTTIVPSQKSKDKGKVIMIEPEVPLKKKDQERLDKEVAAKLQAEFDEEERLVREEAEQLEQANIALINSWDDVHAKIKADQLLAERLQAKQKEELTEKEKARLFIHPFF